MLLSDTFDVYYAFASLNVPGSYRSVSQSPELSLILSLNLLDAHLSGVGKRVLVFGPSPFPPLFFPGNDLRTSSQTVARVRLPASPL